MWFLYFILFFFIFRSIGSFVIKFLLNGNVNSTRATGNFSADFHRILNEMMKNMNQKSGSYNQGCGNEQSSRTSSNIKMSRKEAHEILGLDENASHEDIKSAYRKLMMKMHPDSGGSKYLSQKINEAKSVLLGE